MRTSFNNGFTILEILVVVAIMGFIATLSLTLLPRFRAHQEFQNTREHVYTLLQETKERARGSESFTSYGVHLESDSLTIFPGEAYDVASVDNDISELGSTVVIDTISLEGDGSNVVFTRNNGSVEEYGSFIIRDNRNTSRTHTFSITQTGVISVQ